MRPNKKWVPAVIRRLFKSQARTLLETILHLIPPNCTCNNTTPKTNTKLTCLHCCFHQDYNGSPVSYLIRPDDPPDYRILLNRTFVVLPLEAPPLLPDSTSARRWSLFQILTRTIETMLADRARSSNLLCCGYDKLKDLGSNAKLLNSSAWDLVSQRVGERTFSYILLHAFIFLRIPYGKYKQVAGLPATGFISEFRRHASQQESSAQQGSKKKRKRPTRVSSSHMKKPSCVLPFRVEGPPNSFGLSEVVGSEESIILSDDKGNEAGHTFSTSQENVLLCSCCSMFKTSLGVSKCAEIPRPALYNLDPSPYLLPKNHMLYTSKLSFGGAYFVIRRIFGLPKANYTAQRNPCSHSKGYQSHGSPYHSLLKLLKVVIRRAHYCNSDILLDRHCPVPIWFQNKHCDLSTGLRRGTTLPAKRQLSNLPENDIPNKRSKTSKSSCGRSEMKCVDSPPFLNLCINSRKRKSEREVFDSQPRLSKCFSSRDQVVSFVWAACRKIVPPGLLGPPSSWRILRRNISRFIHLRRFEKFTLKQCMSDLKMSEFPAISSKCYLCCSEGQIGCGNREIPSSDMRRRLLEMWIFWFFSHFVAPIIQANFYVTESEHGKQELYFYRKSVWKKISDQAIASLKEQGFSTAYRTSVRNIVGNRPWGFSKLRFCPKELGVRPIANLSAPSRIFKRDLGVTDHCWRMPRRVQSCPGNDQFGYAKSVNHFLRDTHSQFRDMCTKEPRNWGASVFNYNDVYEKLVPFLMSLKEGMKVMPTPFIVVSDVKKAFDTVGQDMVFNIVNEILMQDEYLLQKTSEIACRKKSLWVYENLRLMNNGSTEIKSSGPSRPCNTIVVDQEQSQNIRKEEIKYYLQELLKYNVVYIDQRFFLQNVGIPQGSVLSSLLCSLYLGHLERKRIFPFLKRLSEVNALEQEIDHVNDITSDASCKAFGLTKYILLRFVDDYLFITTSKKLAAFFLSRLEIGFAEYNCYMNKDKFCLNFEMDDAPIVPRCLVVGDDGVSFIQWSGLLINCCTLEVQADYTRYMNNHLRSTLTISWRGSVGRQLKSKLCDYMRPKCHPIFFDSNINSPSTVRLNVYQALLLAAMKFHCYVRELSTFYKHPPELYVKAIEKSIRYMHKLICKRMKTASVSSKWKPILKLEKDETMWLGRSAYIRVLNKKESRHKEVICILRSKLAAKPQGENGSSWTWLNYAVDESHSSHMWKLKY